MHDIYEIVKKTGFTSVEELIEHERTIYQKYKGYEVDWPSPLESLSFDEITYLRDYIIENKIDTSYH